MSTKIALTLAAAAIAGSATIASANANYFSIIGEQDARISYVDIPVVRAADAGFVQIETLKGDILGMETVNAGANADVRIQFDMQARNDVIAKLFLDGVEGPVAETRIDVETN